jgi:hypothetical protein
MARRSTRATLAVIVVALGCSSPPPTEAPANPPASPSLPAPPPTASAGPRPVPPPGASPPLAPAASAAPSAGPSAGLAAPQPFEQTRRYVGFKCGVAHPETGTSLRLPEGLSLGSVVRYPGPVHLVFAKRGADLVALLLDGAGVVADSVELPGAAAALRFMPGCSAGADDVHVSVVPKACAGPVTAPRAWNAQGGRLAAVPGHVTCVCDAP